MKISAWTVVLFCLLCASAEGHDKRDKAACAEVKAQIRNIQSRMRSGYTRAQGERYAARLRELKARRAKICR